MESARLEVELLLAEVLGLGRVDLYVRHDMPVPDADRDRFREFVKRRVRREPVAYILGHREFYGWDFVTDPRALIPRPETEHLVDEALSFLRGLPGDRIPSAVDLGTGSGCIAICLAKGHPTVEVTAVDRSPAALDLARTNADRLGVGGRIVWLQGDLFAPLDGRPAPDLLVSNPPYIATSEAPSLPPDVVDHEPALALFSGSDPLAFHRRILEREDAVAPGGRVLLELPDGGDGPLREFLQRARLSWRVRETVRDLAGVPRVFGVDRPAD